MLPVSIIIPAYLKTLNEAVWLSECIQSALENDCEVIVWDDGTSIVDVQNLVYTMNYGYKIGVNKVRGSAENMGVAAARNSAVKLSTQPFILPLDCDDILKPGSVKKLLDAWTGKPVYSDVEKFGDVVVPHFALLDFSCEELLKNVGPYPVSVLHTREQHDAIGGWDESLDFYEDGEYNARLMMEYCGQRYPEPLLRYRFHEGQRTQKYRGLESKYIKKIMSLNRSKYNMAGCCGGRRKTMFGKIFNQSYGVSDTSIQKSDVSVQVQFSAGELAIPLEADGKVLARYIGGHGKGKHVYKGNASGFAHKRIQFGDLVYTDPRDVKDSDNGFNMSSFLVKVKVASTPVPVRMNRIEVPEKQSIRRPILDVEKEPVLESVTLLDGTGEEVFLEPEFFEEEDTVDISELTAKQVMKDITNSEDAEYWLPIEKQGKNRRSVVEYLKNIIANG